MELRFIKRGGKKVLQYRCALPLMESRDGCGWTPWKDVPFVDLEVDE